MNLNIETKAELKAKAIAFLKPLFKKRKRILIVVMKVSNSGMSRQMRILCDDRDITGWISDLIDYKRNKDWNIVVGGCGMDMTFWLADRITKELYGNKPPKWLTGNAGSCIEWNTIF